MTAITDSRLWSTRPSTTSRPASLGRCARTLGSEADAPDGPVVDDLRRRRGARSVYRAPRCEAVSCGPAM